MSNINKWRFPSNGYAATSGLDTADLETFKSDVNAALAREITQNSIDARNANIDKPVKIEFKTFKINKNKIPGYNDLIKNINHCIDYWNDYGSEKTVTALKEMLKELNKDQIMCLRISDYNTIGLLGISKDDNSHWNNLIHGSGVSEKSSTSGGSKGIGKFATFVNSYFRTVFYSTYTKDNEKGYEGVCKLCSGNIPGTDEKTQGIGYFGSNDKNQPVFEQLNIDKTHSRKHNEYGTDIYILGFKFEENWKEEIICKVLDSFISAIVFESLEVIVDNIKISKENLHKIVYDNKIVRTKQQRQKILSQYLLLTDEKTIVKEIDVNQFGTVKLYVRIFEGEEREIATNKCTMIRYPYMKIKDHALQSLAKVSAICIIPNNRLNEELRKIENPQHIDWEFNRISNIPIRNAFKTTISDLYKQIAEFVNTITLNSSQKQVALEGSEQHISQVDDEEDNRDKIKQNENITGTTLFRTKPKQEDPINKDKSETDIPDFGDTDPVDPEKPKTNEPKPKEPKPIDETPPPKIKRVEIKNLNFKFMCSNKVNNEYFINFISNVTEDDAEVVFLPQDEGNYRVNIEICDCSVNGYPSLVEDNSLVHLKLKKGEEYNIKFTSKEKEMFAFWIKAYAYKK